MIEIKMRLIGSFSFPKGSSLRPGRRLVHGLYASNGDATSQSICLRLNSSRAGIHRLANSHNFWSIPTPMTSRAVLNSLHSIRFHRALFNGRRFRFLDSVAFYAGRQRSHDRFRKATYQTSSQKTIFHAFATHTFLCSKSIVDLDVEYNVEIISGGRPFNNKASSDITTFTTNLQVHIPILPRSTNDFRKMPCSL